MAGILNPGQAQRRRAPGQLALDAQRLAAGDQDGQRWTGAQEPAGERRAGVDQVLAAVQDQECATALEASDEHVDHRPPRLLSCTACTGYGLLQQPGVAQGRQLYQPGAVSVAVE